MRRSSCSTTPISTRRSRARWRPNTATPARPASAPTACWCRTASTTPSPRSSPQAVKALKVGNGAQTGVTTGPLINRAAVAKVAGAYRRRACQGREARRRRQERSAAISSSRRLLRDVTPNMAVAREETFGPVAPLFRFKTEDEAIEMANATEFGLACYFYARDIGRVWRVAEGPRIRHGRHQRRHHLDGGGAVRRRQGKRPWARRFTSRRRGISGNEVFADGRTMSVHNFLRCDIHLVDAYLLSLTFQIKGHTILPYIAVVVHRVCFAKDADAL